MKKTITTLAIAGVAGASVASAQLGGGDRELSVSATFGYESEYIFRGQKQANQSFQPAVDLSYGGFYAGIWNNNEIDGDQTSDATSEEVDFYAGYSYDIDETFSVDIGSTYFYFPDDDSGAGGGANATSTFESYVGLNADVLLAPSAYVYYDWDLEALTLEGSVGHSFEIAEKTSLDLSATGGWVDTDDNSPDDGSIDNESENWYWSAKADVTYAIAENASISAGPRVGGFDVEDDSSTNPAFTQDSDEFFWWGASFTAGF